MAHSWKMSAMAAILTAAVVTLGTSLPAAAAQADNEEDATTIHQFVVNKSGERVVTGSMTADEIESEGWYVTDDDTLYYYYADGTYATGDTTLSDGYTYAFAADGALEIGWQTVDGKRYYYSEVSGQPSFGWIAYTGELYYVDEDDGKLVGDVSVDDVRYLFDEYGRVVTGWVTYDDGAIYYYDDDATVMTGWQQNGDDWYYLTSSSGALMGWQTLDGVSYYFGDDGAMATGLTEIDGDTYYFDDNGTMVTGWMTVGSKKYYFGTNGVAVTGWQTIDGKTYYFSASGATRTGLVKIDGEQYYFDASGVMQTGWVTIDGESYYFESDGTLSSTGYAPVYLDVVDYKQYDSQWANKTISSQTIGQVGCLVTSIAMKYSYENNTTKTPDAMLSLLSMSGDSVLWSSYTNLGWTLEQPSSCSQSVLKQIYELLLDDTPVIVGGKKSSGSMHFVIVTGYKGSTSSTLSTSDFVINDPGSSSRTTLAEFFAVYPNIYEMIY